MNMKWIQIGQCNCYLSARTINQLEAQARKEREEAEAVAQEREAWHQMMVALYSAKEHDWDVYSDLYKDIFGVRPH